MIVDPRADCAIRQLHARYVDAVWRQDRTAFGRCFTAEAQWLIAGIDSRGRAAIADTFARLCAPSTHVLLQSAPPLLLPRSAEVMAGRSFVTELIRRADGTVLRTIGRYDDLYRPEDGAWRFARREWSFHYRGAPLLGDDYLPVPDPGALA
jgi:hypothetical protein